jgi:hypothetical protein
VWSREACRLGAAVVRRREARGAGAVVLGAWNPAATTRGVGSPAAPVHGGGRARTWGRRRKKIDWSGAGQGPFCKFDRTTVGSIVPRQPDIRIYLSEIVLVRFNATISAHWYEFMQNR